MIAWFPHRKVASEAPVRDSGGGERACRAGAPRRTSRCLEAVAFRRTGGAEAVRHAKEK